MIIILWSTHRRCRLLTIVDYANAIDYYTKALAVEPASHTVLSNRCITRLKVFEQNHVASEADLALADANECIRVAPSWGKGYARKAAVLTALERYSEALEACDNGISLVGEDDSTIVKQLGETKNAQFRKQIMGE